MSLREKIENNLAIWLLGALATGFLAGIGSYQTVLEIARLEVITKSRLEELEAQATIASSESQAKEDLSLKQVPDSQGKADASGRSSEQTDPVSAREPEHFEMRISGTLAPFPENFEQIRPGMRLSEARVAFPNGRMVSGWYQVMIEEGPFHQIAFYAFSAGEDPPVDAIHFFFRNDDARQVVLTEALRKFGGVAHKSESLGGILKWPDLNSFALTITDNSYQISRRVEK